MTSNESQPLYTMMWKFSENHRSKQIHKAFMPFEIRRGRFSNGI